MSACHRELKRKSLLFDHREGHANTHTQCVHNNKRAKWIIQWKTVSAVTPIAGGLFHLRTTRSSLTFERVPQDSPMSPLIALAMFRCMPASTKSSSLQSMRNRMARADRWAPAECPTNTMLSWRGPTRGRSQSETRDQNWHNCHGASTSECWLLGPYSHVVDMKNDETTIKQVARTVYSSQLMGMSDL